MKHLEKRLEKIRSLRKEYEKQLNDGDFPIVKKKDLAAIYGKKRIESPIGCYQIMKQILDNGEYVFRDPIIDYLSTRYSEMMDKINRPKKYKNLKKEEKITYKRLERKYGKLLDKLDILNKEFYKTFEPDWKKYVEENCLEEYDEEKLPSLEELAGIEFGKRDE